MITKKRKLSKIQPIELLLQLLAAMFPGDMLVPGVQSAFLPAGVKRVKHHAEDEPVEGSVWYASIARFPKVKTEVAYYGICPPYTEPDSKAMRVIIATAYGDTLEQAHLNLAQKFVGKYDSKLPRYFTTLVRLLNA